MNRPLNKDSTETLREHLRSVADQSGIVPLELANEPEIPRPLVYLWSWFNELQSARTSSGFGVNPISYTEVDAWARLTERRLEPWEVDCLRQLDQQFVISTQAKD